MKKYFLGLAAVVIAIASYSFTVASNTLFEDCSSTNLIWYKVLPGEGVDQFSNPMLSQLDLDDYSDINGDNSVTEADFTGRTQSQSGATTQFSCNTDDLYVCAVGFVKDASPAGEFEIVSGKLQPKANAVIACKIYREVE